MLQFLGGGSLWDKLCKSTNGQPVAMPRASFKPANILFDEHGYPNPSDFGVAKALTVAGAAPYATKVPNHVAQADPMTFRALRIPGNKLMNLPATVPANTARKKSGLPSTAGEAKLR